MLNRILIHGAVLALAAWTAASQTTEVSVTGSVTDPSGAAVPGAKVVAANVKTGQSFSAEANDAGVYLFAALPPGSYRLSGERTGFRKFVLNELELEVGAKLNINIPLEVGAATEIVEVTAEAQTSLSYLSSSVGNVVTGRQVLELPLQGRSAYDLITTQAGVVGANFSGNRTGSLNVTLDGVNIQDNLLNGLFYIAVANSVRVDRIEEFRIITSPTDAELGRGSGQIQMLTRSGTNEYHGSLFHEHRNTVLTANTWFNNQRGLNPNTGEPVSPRDNLIRNQYGGRLGGPIRKSRTFFHFGYEGQRQRERNAVTTTVYTAPARQGLFRYFPNVRNGNANTSVPTVDLQGNPVRPAGAAGDLQTVSVFGRDPARMAADASGIIAKQFAAMPLPNNFRAGDGLNTAGFTWSRSRIVDFSTIDLRVDHQFNSNHRMSFTFGNQGYESFNVAGPQRFPTSPRGGGPNDTKLYSTSLTSVLKPTLLNEFRAGVNRPLQKILAPWEVDGDALQARAGDYPYLISFGNVDSPLYNAVGDDPSRRITPVYQFGDTITWSKGRHALRGGAEVRFVSSAGYDAFVVTPRATLGAGAVPVQNILTIAGIGQNGGGAAQMLAELNGSLNGATQVFNSPGGADPAYLAGQTRYRNWRQKEIDWFFKDDFKISRSLTLNFGVRWEWYAVPFDPRGRTLGLAGGSGSIFGLSGDNFGSLFQPGRLGGSLTNVVAIGPGTSLPSRKLYQNDYSNYSPSLGLSWSLPWFGKDKTVFRAGYGIGYERNPIYLVHTVSGMNPGYSEARTFTTASLLTVSNLRLPLTPTGRPLTQVPLTDRSQTVYTFDDRMRTPYIQNWNASIQRAIGRNSVLDVRYVGSKGTKLIRDASINEVNIFENGILEAFLITQAGGHAPLMDRLFRGLNVPGAGVVDGVNITGSDAARLNTLTQGFFTNNSPGGFANYLNTATQFTNERGGLLRRAGLPENFVVANPQFGSAMLTGNFASSSYHSLQVELMKRFGAGWTFQGNYTWSKTLGEEDGEGAALGSNYRTLRNRSMDKRLLSYHRAHVWRSNALYELPFGPGKKLGGHSSGVLARIIGGWQTGTIFNIFSGAPISLGAVGAFNTFGNTTAVALADVPKSLGTVERTGNGVVYFSGLRQTVDPSVARITTVAGIQGRSTMLAVSDASGRPLLANPVPGQLGTVAPGFLEGPGSFRLDLNLIKRVKIAEGKELHLRADAINATNNPQFSNPNTDINSLSFGRITGAGGNRIVVVGARFNF